MKSDTLRAAQIFENVLTDRGCEQAYNDEMAVGTRFRDPNGHVWTRVREHGAHGVYVTVQDDRFESCFAGCATPEVVE